MALPLRSVRLELSLERTHEGHRLRRLTHGDTRRPGASGREAPIRSTLLSGGGDRGLFSQFGLSICAPMPEKYIKPAVVAAGALMMLLGVYQLAGWWGLLTALGATLLLFGALN
jgi:hypothetical protein